MVSTWTFTEQQPCWEVKKNKMNYAIPILPSWTHELGGSTAVSPPSVCYCFSPGTLLGLHSLGIYPCKILPFVRHWCFPVQLGLLVWNTCHLFFVALKVAGILASVAALRYAFSVICDLFITLFVALESRILSLSSSPLWIPRVLFTCGPATVMWRWVSCTGRAGVPVLAWNSFC